MKIFYSIILSIALLVIIIASPISAKTLDISWEDLIPERGKGIAMVLPKDDNVIGVPTREELADFSDSDYNALVEELRIPRYNQQHDSPIRVDLDGKSVRIAGYITPVEIEGEFVTSFLLVPYVGACIHVPSPPGNQIVFVSKIKNLSIDEIYDPVWVTGELQAKPLTTVLANVGYRMERASVVPYTQ